MQAVAEVSVVNLAPTCPQCGAAVPDDAPRGFCPRCLVRLARNFVGAAEEPEDVSPDGQLPPASAPAEPTDGAPALQGQTRLRFGDYELLEPIGRGGMGVVYRARQLGLDRLVAVKMILAEQLASPAALQRFRTEAQAAARLQHPNIVAIHEVGEHRGQPYFSMDYVEGATLAELARDRPLPTRRATRYAQLVAEAVHYAHERGVLHRDLKPSNILIDPLDQPRITDFGLAKRLAENQRDPDRVPPESAPAAKPECLFPADERPTESGQVLGSPGYLPPEQAGAPDPVLGPACDVYSLGAVLYHLLTGRPPFLSERLEDTLEQVRRKDPVAPRLLNRSVPRDVETICLKCLEKNPRGRYDSAQALADDLKRFLEGKPIRARRVTPLGRLWRWCRRQPALAVTISTVLLLLGVLAGGAVVAAWQIAVARQEEQLQHHRAEAALAQMRLQKAEELFGDGRTRSALAYLARVLRQDPSNRLAAERLWSALSQRSFPILEGVPVPRQNIAGTAQFSPESAGVVAASVSDAPISVACLRQEAAGTLRHEPGVRSARFSPDGQRVLTVGRDKAARLWDWSEGRLLSAAFRHDDRLSEASFSPDGLRVLTASWDNTARLWDVASGVPLTEPLRHRSGVRSARFSADGQRVVTDSEDGTTLSWDTRPGAALAVAIPHDGAVLGARFSPDGRHVLTGDRHGQARVWRARSGQPRSPPLSHTGAVLDAVWSPDGTRVATASTDQTARVWEAATGQPVSPPLRHRSEVVAVRFSPDGLRLATASADGMAAIWRVKTGERTTVLTGHTQAVNGVEFSPDGGWLATVGEDRTARWWDLRTGQSSFVLGPPTCAMACAHLSPDGTRWATGGRDKLLCVWDTRTGKRLVNALEHNGRLNSVQFDPAGRRLLTASEDRTARLWDAASGRPLTEPLRHLRAVKSARFSPDGGRVVTVVTDGTVQVWDAQRGEPLSEPLPHGGTVFSVEFSPDGHWLVTACEDGQARLWEVPVVRGAVPGWLAPLAEALGGQRLNAEGVLEHVPVAEVRALRQEVLASAAGDVASAWGKWFFADRATRAISPGASVTVPEYVQRLIASDTTAGLRQAVILCPTNGLALARLARSLLAQAPAPKTNSLAEAELLSRLASQFSPETKEVWRTRVEVLERAGRHGEAQHLRACAERAAP
ncbi:MAG: protein kinase [Verrucomicrobia bacterium]|nr:protein kinase [Verrucomicrobiota bacterium]